MNFWPAIIKYISYFPDGKLTFIYELSIKQKDGSEQKIFTQDKKFVKRYKNNDMVSVKKKLMCRTLY